MSTVSKNKVLALFGPTACGKTALLKILFANSDRPVTRPVAVVSADSVQVYRGLDIGAAKPDSKTVMAIPHYLIDIRDPSEAFSMGDFVRLADEACDEIIAGGGVPVISGGTAYYIKAFILGLPIAPPSDPAIRAKLQAELAAPGGPERLQAELAKVDPQGHARIASADHYRISRALEVYRCSGRPLSSFALPDKPRRRWDVLAIGIDRDRSDLYRRINARVEAMMDDGLEEEVSGLLASGYTRDDPALKGIGYAEFIDSKLNDPAAHGPERHKRISEAIAQNTRHYAKRQLTFMRSLDGVRWFHPDETEKIRASIEGHLAPERLFDYNPLP